LRSSQEQIRESAERFQAFFHSAAVGAARADVETGRFLEVNDTFCRMTGYGRDELQAMTFLDITHPDDKGVTVEHQRLKLRDPNHNYELDKRYVRKDGQTIWVRVAILAARRPQYVCVRLRIKSFSKSSIKVQACPRKNWTKLQPDGSLVLVCAACESEFRVFTESWMFCLVQTAPPSGW
jgi:PAS domain S-box-containing protein